MLGYCFPHTVGTQHRKICLTEKGLKYKNTKIALYESRLNHVKKSSQFNLTQHLAINMY